jgi:cephalosporin-C deacetylase
MLQREADGSFDERAVQALRYVDVMNHASRITCRTFVSVGFIDKTCPPSSVYAAFNNIPSATDKTMVTRPEMAHAFPADLIAAWDEEIRAHIQSMRSGARGGVEGVR